MQHKKNRPQAQLHCVGRFITHAPLGSPDTWITGLSGLPPRMLLHAREATLSIHLIGPESVHSNAIA
ncbi:hypothetical protein GNP94_15665 [Paenibacillus campinasensis]|uniref:Uncharacterized protein n=1 Tax=Paenibacillus campinasensis TaxID=66347 RepID=A0ABW9T2S3_9BACL|nr:hypothetical protein [Paenibacillus campinasensis]MUG67424.1 hypothetical protein [Paenibacillus campinasensis]